MGKVWQGLGVLAIVGAVVWWRAPDQPVPKPGAGAHAATTIRRSRLTVDPAKLHAFWYASDSPRASPKPPTEVLETTTLPVKLLGTAVASQAEYSSALLDNPDSDELMHVGDRVGGADIVEIGREYVVFDEQGRRTIARLGQAPQPGAHRVQPRPPPQSTRALPQPRLQGPVQQVGPHAWHVGHAWLQGQMQHAVQEAAQMRAEPRHLHGKFAGVVLRGLPAGLWRDLGLREGDVLLAVGNTHLTSLGQALTIPQVLGHKARLLLLIERDGQPMALRYTMTPP